MELHTLLEAHPFEDLRADLEDGVSDMELGGGADAIQSLLLVVGRVNERYLRLHDDYTRWTSGSRITKAGKTKARRHVVDFRECITGAALVLKTVGVTVLVRVPWPIWPPGWGALRPRYSR